MKRSYLVVFFVMLCLLAARSNGWAAQKKGETYYPFQKEGLWTVSGKTAQHVAYKDKQALQIQPAAGEGVAWLNGVEFKDGAIEVDIAAIPRFTGIVFRLQDERIFEGIYFRPQNSRHADPAMRQRTIQYVSHPGYPWYYLRDRYPGKYEAAVDLDPDEWFHVRLEVYGTTVKVFVNHAETPCLVVEDLKLGHAAGKVGVWCGNTSGGTFAGFTLRHEGNVPAAAAPVFDSDQRYLFDTMASRRSVRAFKPTPVPPAHVLKILDMARTAPTSGNQQPWKFLVIQDRGRLDQLRDACVAATLERAKSRGDLSPDRIATIEKDALQRYGRYLSAPVYISVLTDKHSRYPSYNVYDGALAGGYLMIAARALGYGTVFSQDSIPYGIIAKVFSIPDQYEQICFTPIGVPEEWPQSPPKKPLDDFLVFESFVKGINYTPPVVRTEIPLPKEALQRFVGKYELQPDFVLDIQLEENGLFVLAPGQPKLQLFPETRVDFFFKVIDAQISFQEDAEGAVAGLVFIQGDRRMNARKL